jgi:SPP1 family predicted phage head-tail adaptor
MDIGNKRDRITVQRRTKVPDADGDLLSETWATYCERWARVIPAKGREFTAQDRIKSEASHRLFTRYDTQTAAIRTTDRVLWRGLSFDVLSVTDVDARKREVEIALRRVEG